MLPDWILAQIGQALSREWSFGKRRQRDRAQRAHSARSRWSGRQWLAHVKKLAIDNAKNYDTLFLESYQLVAVNLL